MIFNELVIHNFGVYKGRHTIDLTTKSTNKPIILIGAFNGSGKTTFLDALQLALYGKFADCSNRGSLSYHDYLLRTINAYSNPADGAELQLQFTQVENSTNNKIRIIRSWRSTGKGIKEAHEVFRNGVFDPSLTERWYEYVEEFIPSQVSSLFFFDGEKIEALADKERASTFLRTGVHALLGLNLVEQLSKDLGVLQTRRQRTLLNSEQNSKLETLDTSIRELQTRTEYVHAVMAETRSKLDRLNQKESQTKAEFRREGGELLEQREALENEERITRNLLERSEDKLRELAAGLSPLLLIRGLLNDSEEQAKKEHTARIHKELREAILSRDTALLKHLKEQSFDERSLKIIKRFHDSDLESREAAIQHTSYIKVEPSAFAVISREASTTVVSDISTHLNECETLAERLSSIEKKIASIPDPKALEGITSRLASITEEKSILAVELSRAEAEYDVLQKHLGAKHSDRERYLEQTTQERFKKMRDQKINDHSTEIQNILRKYRRAIAEKSVANLERLIADSFRDLVRKSDLIERVAIDLETYELRIFKANGDNLPTERLSAGERQLLAVSILWGLAKASGRPLPTIIDTPLGRLDGYHREHLVKSYFPFASHQVILLSTDEEIDEVHETSLRSAISKRYLISYTETKQTSIIEEGYFWG